MARAQDAPPPAAGLEAAPLHVRIQADRALRVAAATSEIGDLHRRLEGLEVEGSVEGIRFLAPLSAGWILAFRWSPPPPETFLERLLRPVGPPPQVTDARLRPPPSAVPAGC